MQAVNASSFDWLRLIESEYMESPGLRLTKPQARRFWGLDGATCDALFETLVDGKFLKMARGESYVRVTEG